MATASYATLLLALALPLAPAADKAPAKTPFMLRQTNRLPPPEIPRDATVVNWRVAYIGCADPNLSPPDQQADHRDSAFLLTGATGTALYVSSGSASAKPLDYQGNVELPGPLGKVTCYVYAEKQGSKLWYFATTPAPKPATPKFFAVSFADTSQQRPMLVPFTWAMQTDIATAAGK